MGTDELGRDILSRIIIGARLSLAVAFSSTLLAGIAGVLVGVAVTYVGGLVEAVVMRIVDLLIALPEILFAILMMTLSRPARRA